MKEKETKTVEIQDLDPDVMLEMLKFIYIGSCSINIKNPDPDAEDVMGLLEAADKYHVDVLKDKCEEVMISILEPNNCLRILEKKVIPSSFQAHTILFRNLCSH